MVVGLVHKGLLPPRLLCSALLTSAFRSISQTRTDTLSLLGLKSKIKFLHAQRQKSIHKSYNIEHTQHQLWPQQIVVVSCKKILVLRKVIYFRAKKKQRKRIQMKILSLYFFSLDPFLLLVSPEILCEANRKF